MHSYQEQFIQPDWTECVFVYLALVCILCFFDLFVCPRPFVFPGQLSHLAYSSWC